MAEKMTDKGLVVGLIIEHKEEVPNVKPVQEPKPKSAPKAKKD